MNSDNGIIQQRMDSTDLLLRQVIGNATCDLVRGIVNKRITHPAKQRRAFLRGLIEHLYFLGVRDIRQYRIILQ